MSIADRVQEVHDEAMKMHVREIRSQDRFLIGFVAFCALVAASSAILLWAPPPGFAPPESFVFSGHFKYQMLILISAILGFTGLLCYAFTLLARQVHISQELMKVIRALTKEVQANATPTGKV